MPDLFAMGYLLPLTFYLEIVRGIILKGIGINYLLSQLFALTVFTAAVLTAGIMKFQKKL